MSLLELITNRWHREDQIADLAELLVRECAHATIDRLNPAVYHMTRYESRGYIRARALGIVKRVVAHAAPEQELSPDDMRKVQAMVLQATTRMVHQHVLSHPWRSLARVAA